MRCPRIERRKCISRHASLAQLQQQWPARTDGTIYLYGVDRDSGSKCPATYGLRDTCRTTQLLRFQKQCISWVVLKEKQRMAPVIAPCQPPYSAGVTDDLAALMPPGTLSIALFRVLAHNPRILSRLRAGRLLDPGALSVRERELLILRVCHRCDCEYEWNVHVGGFSDAAGLADADLHATLQPTAEAPLSSRERLMLAAADELVDARRLTPATTAGLRHDLVPAEIVELIALVARYMWVSIIANTAALPREAGVRPWAESIK
jgi:alkylhydroperoxidase family enzyme